jgi:hypothetical protein
LKHHVGHLVINYWTQLTWKACATNWNPSNRNIFNQKKNNVLLLRFGQSVAHVTYCALKNT